MKNKLLLSLLVSLFAMSAWADVSVVENFTNLPQVNTGTEAPLGTGNGYDFTGDACAWHLTFVRWAGSNDWITVNSENLPAMWLSKNATSHAEMATTNWEGGIKAVSFRWAQFGGEAGNTLKLQVAAGDVIDNSSISRAGGDGTNKGAGGEVYNHDFECKANAQLVISNISTKGGNNDCRILVNELKITPYILYTQKKAVIGLTKTGYRNLNLIDNTGEEGSISYSIHDKDAETQNVAEINSSTGEITPKAVGRAIVTASLSEGASTSYELIIANTVVETFSSVSQPKSSGTTGATWTGDICTWTNKYARRGTNDLINGEQATWLTLDGTTRGYLQTTNLGRGLLGVTFDYAQFGEETGKVLKWQVSDGTSTYVAERDGDIGANKDAPDIYSCVFENHQDAQLEILNASIMDNGTQPTNNARLLIHNLTIAPYLFYTTKAAQLDMRTPGNTTYKNENLVDNTALEPGTDVVYSISPDDAGASIDDEGLVTAVDGTQGNFTVTATWGDVSTSYVLTIISRNETSASFDGAAIVNLGLSDAAPTKTLTYTAGYDGTAEDITYSSNNGEVATVANNGTVSLAGGVGQAIITAHLAQTENYKAAEASYIIQVTDDGANIQVETFSAVPNGNAAAHTDKTWDGDLFNWYTTEYGGVRKNGDKFPSDNTSEHTGIWMGIPDATDTYATLQSKEAIEGGIKHMSFYWEQWGAESEHILNPVIYIKTGDNEPVQKASVEYMPTGSPVAANRMLIGINDVRSNSQLIIRNESHKSDGSRVNGQGRIILDEIHITPWLLYTTKEGELDMRTNVTTYKNEALINNTGTTPTYSISPLESGATIDNTGLVTAEEGTQGEFMVTASWGDVSTSYVLTIISRNETSASYANADVRLSLGATVPANTLTITDGYDGTVAYESSNTAVATVDEEGVVSLAGGVGQTTITATLPQTTNYKAASASYNLYVRDNGARIEMFSGVSQSSVVGETLTDWNGDLFTWQAQYQVRRGTNDTIHAGISKHQGTSIGIQDPTGTPLSSILQSKGAVEGGIKYLTFYWMQWGAAGDGTRRIAVYADDELIGYQENPNGASGKTGDEFMLGINNAMKSNKQLVIKNESYKGSVGTLSDASNSSRIVLDNIYITPYLRYTLKEATLDMRNATTYTNTNLINNTGGNNITYTLENPSVEEMATIDSESGEVTGHKAGQVTVKATWNEVGAGASAWYTLNIVAATATEASFEDAIVHIGLNGSVSNSLNITEGYEDELASESKSIGYTSSNPAVASVASNGAITINGVGKTIITASLPATTNFTAAEASYILYVRDNANARVETFSGVSQSGVPTDTEIHDWTGDLLDWQIQYQVRRGNNDKISAGTEEHQGTSIGIQDPTGTPLSSILQTKGVVEGGIKYLSFYWAQFGSGQQDATRRIAVYADDNLIGFDEIPAGNTAGTESFLGINNAMKANKQLIIKNESYSGTVGTLSSASNNSRNILDNIYITPWLLFTDKAERVLRIGETDKNESLINNTGADATFISSDPDVASVADDGTVTAKARGKVIITAKYQWSEEEVVTTTYPVAVYPVNCETFSQNTTAHTYHTAQYGNSYDNPEPVVEDKCTWYAWLGGVVPSNYEPNIAVIRAPRADEQGPAYLRSGALEGGIASMTFDWNLVDNESNINWDIRVLVNGSEVKQLGNDDLSMTPLTNFGQIEITGIKEPGNFVITFENHSTVIGDYPAGKNKARFVIDNVTWTNYGGTKTLSEGTDNSAWLAANNGETRNVEIVRSALVGGVWNTLCLPFAIEQSKFGAGVDVQRMSSATLEDEELTIGFSAHTGDLEAGVPYLIKPSSDVTMTDTYENKPITMTALADTYNGISLQGIFNPKALIANDTKTLFVSRPNEDGDNLFYSTTDATMPAFRAYIQLPDGGSGAPKRARFIVNQKEVATDIVTVSGERLEVSGKFIENGQLIILRDGKKYNAIGQIIR